MNIRVSHSMLRSSNSPRRQQLSERTGRIMMYTCLAGGINVWSICNKNSLKGSVFCRWNESRKRDSWCVSLGMISVYPCRNKLFKARDWKWGGRGGVPGKKEMEKKEREGERWRENRGGWSQPIWKRGDRKSLWQPGIMRFGSLCGFLFTWKGY